MADAVNHPPHYTTHPSGIEAIELCEHLSFNMGNALKYLWRAGKKGAAVEDLKKAKWYFEREQALHRRLWPRIVETLRFVMYPESKLFLDHLIRRVIEASEVGSVLREVLFVLLADPPRRGIFGLFVGPAAVFINCGEIVDRAIRAAEGDPNQ